MTRLERFKESVLVGAVGTGAVGTIGCILLIAALPSIALLLAVAGLLRYLGVI